MISENNDLLANDLSISPSIQDNLATAAKWGKFLAIVGFISCILMVLGGLALAAQMSTLSSYRSLGFNPMLITIVYVIMGLLFFFPCLFLFRFSTKMLEASKTQNQDSLESAMTNLKAMFRFIGIVTIVILSMYVLIIIFAIVGTNKTL